MGMRARVREAMNSGFKRFGFELVPSSSLYPWQIDPPTRPSYQESDLPEGAADYLRSDNPRLEELQRRYAGGDSAVTIPFRWKEGHLAPDDLTYFRGDNAYVWQLRGPHMSPIAYAMATYYAKSLDDRGLLRQLGEDGLFGNFTFDLGGETVSRDLLDSITEIYFLEEHLSLSSREGPTILDIGAGYGRLAHRMLTALPNIETYLCTDAVPLSTFISEYYLRFRNLEDRAKVVPLDEIEKTLASQTVDVAVNVHSFSECTIEAIAWWLSLLAKHEVKHLMIVPNALEHGGELLLTNDGVDFEPVVEKHGYRRIAKEPKYRDPLVQQCAVCPTHYHLFELSR